MSEDENDVQAKLLAQFDPKTAEFDLTTVEGLIGGVGITHGTTSRGLGGPRNPAVNGTFCPNCGDVRRMTITVLHARSTRSEWADPMNLPAAIDLCCVQCHEHIAVLVTNGPEGTMAVAVPTTYGGLSTSRTPDAVAYYLDQAERSRAVGAMSAAVSMYRAALEQLLYHEGFAKGMLAQKIEALEQSEDPPVWFRDLDEAYLPVMRRLGNAAIHPNDGDVTKQEALGDPSFIVAVRALFVELLDAVYEAPARRQERLGKLKAAEEQLVRRRS